VGTFTLTHRFLSPVLEGRGPLDGMTKHHMEYKTNDTG